MSGSETKLRTLRPEDYDFVIARINGWWGGRNLAPGLPRLFFDHFAGTSLAAEDAGGKIVAFLVGFISPQRRDEAYIHYAGVDPEYQRAGLGRRMYTAFFRTALDHGRTVVRCQTSPVNRDSIAFHQKMGFDLVDSPDREEGVPVHRNSNGQGDDKVLFIKKLV